MKSHFRNSNAMFRRWSKFSTLGYFDAFSIREDFQLTLTIYKDITFEKKQLNAEKQ